MLRSWLKERAMKFTFAHNNLNVLDLDKSIEFYRQALGLAEVRRKKAPDGSFVIVFLGDGRSQHLLELTWLRDRNEPYNLGDNEIHLAFKVDDYQAAKALHGKMGCICYENEKMGLYFISDPDGYWTEVVPERR
jgi:lactoylglutathione lyase